MPIEHELLWAMLEGWRGARHEVDSLYLIVQGDPDWKEKFRVHYEDPFRRQMTDERFAPVQGAIRAILDGEEPYSALSQAVAKLEKPPQ